MRLGRTLKGSLETTVERDIAPQRVSGTAKEGKQCPEAAVDPEVSTLRDQQLRTLIPILHIFIDIHNYEDFSSRWKSYFPQILAVCATETNLLGLDSHY